MNPLALIAAGALLLPAMAYANCDSVKSSIHDKISANGVKSFSLKVLPNDQADGASGTRVGTCEGDKTIFYTKGGAADEGSRATSTNASRTSASPASSGSS